MSSATPPSSLPPDLERGTVHGRSRRGVRALLLGLARLLVGLRVVGLERVPRTGPLLVVSNHLHNADPVLVAIAFPRSLHFMAKKELFNWRPLGWLLRLFGTFPVDRGKPDRTALRRAEATLRQGIALGMFPEGTRSVSGALKAALPGAAVLALQSGVPVLPVAITGSERLPGNGQKGRRRGRRGLARGVQVRFGEPFVLRRTEHGVRLDHAAATARLMGEVAALLPPAYRGVYAEMVPGAAADA